MKPMDAEALALRGQAVQVLHMSMTEELSGAARWRAIADIRAQFQRLAALPVNEFTQGAWDSMIAALADLAIECTDTDVD